MAVENYLAALSLTPVTDGNAPLPNGAPSSTARRSREAELAQQIGDHVFRAGLRG